MVIHDLVASGLGSPDASSRYAEFIDFDEGNESELIGHNITAAAVTQLLLNRPAWAPNHKGKTGLWLAVGYTTGGRALTVPVLYDEIRSAVRPITLVGLDDW